MKKAQKKRRAGLSGTLSKGLIAVLAVYLVGTLIYNQVQITAKRQELSDVQEQVTQKQQENEELQRLIGKRAADFYEYAISLQNDCLVCSAYFSRLLEKNHIDFATFDFTDDERLLIEYGRAIARDPKHVPEDLMRLMQQTFTEEQLVVITTMGVFMIANNYFNDILNVDPAPVQE